MHRPVGICAGRDILEAELDCQSSTNTQADECDENEFPELFHDSMNFGI
jgi:hypothetical protein